jgi:hypothetical protein
MSEKEMAGGGIPKVSPSSYYATTTPVPHDGDTSEGGRGETVSTDSAFTPRKPDGRCTDGVHSIGRRGQGEAQG